MKGLPPKRHPVFVEAPQDVDELCEKAAAWDRDYEMKCRDKGIEFWFSNAETAAMFFIHFIYHET